MRDDYPTDTQVPPGHLVPAEHQPEYLDFQAMPSTPISQAHNVGVALSDAQVAHGRSEAVAAIHAESGATYTYGRLARESRKLASGLMRYGIRKGDRIAYSTANDPAAIIVMLAAWKAGAIVVPIPANTRAAEVANYVEDTRPRILFVHPRAGNLEAIRAQKATLGFEAIYSFSDEGVETGFPSWTELFHENTLPAADVDPNQPAIVWHTGGTTGRPKGCYHTHKRFLAAGLSFGAGASVRAGQRWASAAPIGHALGIIHSTIYSMLNGATVVFIENFSDARHLLACIAQYRITHFTALMITWGKMADELRSGLGWNGESLARCFAMWQTASSADIFDFWKNRGVELLNNFGSTSFANWVLIPPLDEPTPRAALGKPMPGYQVEAVEITDGELRVLPRGELGRMAVRGPSGLTYWNHLDYQKRDVVDGWTVCDDIIRYDEGGIAHYLGRSDYMISTAGFKVAPIEVEQALSKHPGVKEVAVIPAPCPIRYEQVCAFIVLNPGFAPGSELKKELRDLVSNELSPYKAPRMIRFIDALPRDSVGKVQGALVKKLLDVPETPAH